MLHIYEQDEDRFLDIQVNAKTTVEADYVGHRRLEGGYTEAKTIRVEIDKPMSLYHALEEWSRAQEEDAKAQNATARNYFIGRLSFAPSRIVVGLDT